MSSYPLTNHPYMDIDVLTQVEHYVTEHLNDPNLDVSALCFTLGLSRTTLHTRIKSQTGMSTTEYVRFLRLSHAKDLIENTHYYISEIAYQTGFQNHNYFSKKFRELYGISPKEWREQSSQI